MRGDEAAYAALGLRPGASRAEVDEAYRRLIKQFHPDRTGGDCSRAAEINRAYTLLRRDGLAIARPRTVPVVMHPPRPRPRSRRSDLLFACALLAIAVAGFASQNLRRSPGPSAYLIPVEWAPADSQANLPSMVPLADFDQPLEEALIDRAIADALKFHESGDLAAATAYSRDCRDKIRQHPSLAWFDACAAFDESMMTLDDDDPGPSSSAFNGAAVMAREMAAARVLSDDILAADSRLHQIRSKVELALLPKLDQAAAHKP